MTAAVVVPTWNSARWIEACLASVLAQSTPPDELLVVDNASSDGTAALVRERFPTVRIVSRARNDGFAAAANTGVVASDAAVVALVNPDVTLAPDWLERGCAALDLDHRAGAVATKMVQLDEPARLYDTGDLLRRDGACEQRGRGALDDGRYDVPGEVWGACAGAALYRRAALDAVGGFDERFFLYLEDVDLALRLRLAGWSCRYEPVVARHAGEASSAARATPAAAWVQRNTLLLVARWFPLRWLPRVAWRQLGWAWHAARERRLRTHARATAAALPRIPSVLRERRADARLRAVAHAVPPGPLRGLGSDVGPAAAASGR